MPIGSYMPLFINHYINRNNTDEKNLQLHEPYAFDAPVRDELQNLFDIDLHYYPIYIQLFIRHLRMVFLF